ncbi:MAG TPA: protein phosphatase 2C domain-containing protein [Terracidiphilus sp.]|nr:protein phosphatase 2C domain-containing protein [Terracidiphilus sp.]
MLDVVFGQASDAGKVRTNNEDAMGAFVPSSRHQARSQGFLFAVADGVGGLDLGEVASATAVAVMLEEFEKAQPGAMLISLLPRLIQFANAAVHDRGLAPEFRGKRMATTLVACALRHDQAIVSHVGDSRCYLVRNGQARQITQDHTWVNQQRHMGLLTAEEMTESEQRHVLTRSLGPELYVSADTTALSLQPGDVLVLSTDGVHDETGPEEIAAIVTRQKDMDAAARELVAHAVERDGNDNTTAQVIRVRSVEQVGMYRGRPYRLSR